MHCNELQCIRVNFCLTGETYLLIFLFILAQSSRAALCFFPRLDRWGCVRCSARRYLFLKRPGVISAFVCLRSQLDTVNCHLPVICDIWQVHKLPLVSALYTILGFNWGCRGNRADIGSKLPSKEYPLMVLEMKSWTSWTLCLCFSRSARILTVFMSNCK